MLVPAGYRRIGSSSAGGIVRDDLAATALGAWWGGGAPLPGARGRGEVRVLRVATARGRDIDGVARFYRRGGVMRSLQTRFLRGQRGARELGALVELRRRGVPAVEPLAAVHRRRGLFVEMRLVTVLLVGSRPLPAFLAAQPEHGAAALREAGRVVGAAFAAGLDHPDLHPDNLLVRIDAAGAAEVVLIDLDRAVIHPAPVPARERDRMLLRMARYLERHAASLPLAAAPRHYLRFLQGMSLGRAGRRGELRRLQPAYERAVARHRVAWAAGK